MNKIWKILVTVLYGLGAATVFILLALAAVKSHIVVFPDAMLPMELHELATVWLMFGFLPVLIVSILFYAAHNISESRHRTRNTILIYIPAAICLLFAFFWVVVWLIGIFHMIGISTRG